MITILQKPWVKGVLAVSCVLCFFLAALSGLGVLTLLYTGAYEGGDSYEAAAKTLMRSDAEKIMYDYFDPDDPAHPWRSYYTGGIYSGDGTNLLWSIAKADTGERILNTWDGQEALLYPIKQTHSFERMVEEPITESPVQGEELTSPVFTFLGTVYGYESDIPGFVPLDRDTAQYITLAQELDPSAVYYGLIFEGEHYAYNREEDTFYPEYPMEEFTYSVVSQDYVLTMGLRSGLPYRDAYWRLWQMSSDMVYYRLPLLAGFILSAFLALILLALLCAGVCHREDTEELVLPHIFRLPTDIALALGLVLCTVPYFLCKEFFPTRSGLYTTLIAWSAAIFILAVLGVYTVVMLAARSKKGVLFTGTLIYWLFRNCFSLIGRAGRFLGELIGYVPLLWKVGVCFVAICAAELFFLMLFDVDGEAVALWLLQRVCYAVLTAYVVLAFHRLKSGAERIATGDYTTPVKEDHLLLDFKSTAHTLNHIQGGMNAAVDSRIRSERMKTELITNVSHDLKTPLTSIVSYVDLLKKELSNTQTVTREAEEYIQVLDRQSGRLKKLIEDLVEASKASTGNLNLELEALDFHQLLGQALGEYSQKLSEAGLILMTKTPEGPVMIQADGRRLWRVFDNLLGNAVKYAMPGTRLYLTVETGSSVTATFRNISREPLDVSAGELMERFVRGDASRHTEGSGLGLSIAKSLTESMGGQFNLEVDGDLFKVSVTFPVLAQLKAPDDPENPA